MMRALSVIACSLASVCWGVEVTDTHILTGHDASPRMGGIVESDTTITGDVPFVEVPSGVTLTIEGECTTNTILGHPGSTIRIKDGATLTFAGDILDADGDSFGRGLIALGHLEAIGAWIDGVPTWTLDDDDQPQYIDRRSITIQGRGHVMVTGDGTYDVRYVHFDGVGRTTVALVGDANPIGRYSFHDHRSDGLTKNFVGNLVTNPLKWSIVLHSSDYATITENVAVGDGEHSGAGIVTEPRLGTSSRTTCAPTSWELKKEGPAERHRIKGMTVRACGLSA